MLTCPGRSWNIERGNRDTFVLYAYKISNTISPKKHTYIYTHIHIYMCSVLVLVDWEIRWSAGGCRECISRRGGGVKCIFRHI